LGEILAWFCRWLHGRAAFGAGGLGALPRSAWLPFMAYFEIGLRVGLWEGGIWGKMPLGSFSPFL